MNRLNKLKQQLDYWQRFLNLEDWDLKIKLVDFTRKDYPQTGDIKVNLKNKSAIVLISKKETGKDSKIILHELIHLILWKLDQYAEKNIPQSKKNKYFDFLEETVANLTRIFLEKDK